MLHHLLVDVALGHELGMDILVAVDVLSGKEHILLKQITDRWQAILTAAHDASCRHMYQTGIVTQAPRRQILDRLDIHAFNFIALGKVLDAGSAIDDGHIAMRCLKLLYSSRIGGVALDDEETAAIQFSIVVAKVVALHGLQAVLAALALARTYEAVDFAVMSLDEFMEHVAAKIAGGTEQQHVANGVALTVAEGLQRVARQQFMNLAVVVAVRADDRWCPGSEVSSRDGFTYHLSLFTTLGTGAEEFGHGLWRGVREHIVVDHLVSGLVCCYDHLHGQNGAAANLEEVGIGTDFLNTQHTAEDTANVLLGLVGGSDVVGSLALGLGQRLLVDLHVHGERNLVNLHDDGRHHVGGFLTLHVGCDGININGALAHDECSQILAATLVVVGLHRDVLDTLETTDDGLHLLGLDTESADFHLSVLTTNELYVTVLTVAHDVAGMIHSPLVERTRLVGLGGLVGTVDIASAHLRPGQTVFAGSTRWQTMTRLVEHVGMDGSHGLSDGDIRFPHLDGEHADAAAVLRRTISVGNGIVDSRGIDGRTLLAGDNQQTELFMGEVLGKLHTDLCRENERGDAFLVEIVCQPVQVHAILFRHQIDRGTHEQTGKHVGHVDVETERGIGCHNVVLGIESVAHAVSVGHDIAVLNLAALGQTCRAGSVEHHKQALRLGTDGCDTGIVHRIQFADGDHLACIFVDHIAQVVFGNQQADASVLHHEVQALLRIAGVEGFIAHTGLDGGQGQDDGLLVARQDDGCHLFLEVGLARHLAANLVDLRRQTVGQFVQLLIRVHLVLIRCSLLVGLFGHHLLEACQHAVSLVEVQVPRLVIAVEQCPLRLVGQTNLCHTVAGSQSACSIMDALCQALHHVLAVHRAVVAYLDDGIFLRSFDIDGHRYLGNIL